jgi:hypothetical protein
LSEIPAQKLHQIYHPKKTAGSICLQEGKLMPTNFPEGKFLRKADKCFVVCIVN